MRTAGLDDIRFGKQKGRRAVLICWARHGQNEANLTRQFSYRRLDLNLTGLGCAQAEQLGDRLAARLADTAAAPAMFSSPLRRARQTAQIVADRFGGNFETLDELREINVGQLDGRGDPAAWEQYDDVLAGWRRGEHDRGFPGGEDWHELRCRLSQALDRVVRHSCGRPAIVVAHGANLRAALPGLAGIDDPGVDLDTGQFADLTVSSTTASQVRLLAWRGGPGAGAARGLVNPARAPAAAPESTRAGRRTDPDGC